MIHEQLIQRVCAHLNVPESCIWEQERVRERLPGCRERTGGSVSLPVTLLNTLRKKREDKPQLWVKVCLDYFPEVRCTASQFDLLEGDLGVFVYTAVLHKRKVGHLGCYSAAESITVHTVLHVVRLGLRAKPDRVAASYMWWMGVNVEQRGCVEGFAFIMCL